MTNLINISKLLKKQNTTTEEQNTTIDAKKLLEYIKKVENGENIPHINGVTIEKIEESGEIVVDVQRVIKGDLNIKGTKVKIIKAKAILGDMFAEKVETLEEIEVEEEVRGNLNIEGTKVKIIKAKQVWGGIFANGVETLEEINVEEINIGEYIEGGLYIEGTNVKKIKANKILGTILIKKTKKLEEIDVGEINLTIGKDGYLDIKGTKVKKIKAKYVWGSIDAEKVETLEEIEVEEKMDGDLDIRGTKIKKISANIMGSINAEGVETLTEMNVKKIIGNLDIIGTNKNFQLEIIDKINKKELIVKGNTYFGGNIQGIEQLCNNKNLIIPGNLDIIGTNKNFQLEIIDKINKKELIVKGNTYFGGNIQGIEKLCNDKNLIIPGNLDIRGTNVEEINLKKVLGHINAEGVTTLKVINVTEGIDGYLDIRGTNVNFQKKILEKKKNGKLKINGELFSDILDVK